MPKQLLKQSFSPLMHIKGNHHIVKLVLPFLLIFFASANANSANIKVISRKDVQSTVFAIQVDEVKKLAGLKVSMEYPKNQYSFVKATKGTRLNSFMHVVNDKVPGKLIVVMASAKGISGNHVTLFEITFSPITTPKESLNRPSITTCELMSEELTVITCNNETSSPNLHFENGKTLPVTKK